VRLEAVCPLLEAGRVTLVEGSWTEDFIKEVTSFPFSTHDDSTDSFAWALTYYALKLDTVDRGLRDTIMQNKQSRNIEGITSSSYKGRMINTEASINDPDYGGLPSGPFYGGGIRGSRRRNIGYDTFL